jgi:hypothetical protein
LYNPRQKPPTLEFWGLLRKKNLKTRGKNGPETFPKAPAGSKEASGTFRNDYGTFRNDYGTFQNDYGTFQNDYGTF